MPSSFPGVKSLIMPDGSSNTSSFPGRKSRKGRWRRRLGISLGLMLALVAAAPYAAQLPPVRDRLVSAVAERQNVRAEVGDASFGWLTPLELRDVRIESPYGDPLLDVERIRAEQPWWGLALSGRRLGRFIIDQPEVTLIASPGGWNFEGIGPAPETVEAESKDATSTSRARKPELTAEVHGAAVRLFRTGVPDPLLDVSKVHVTARLQYVDDTRWLIVQPFQPLDHRPLTPEMCNNGLELIAPILAFATWVEGNISLEIDELRLPLNRAAPAERAALTEGDAAAFPTAVASGELSLHSVETGLKNPVLQEVAQKVASLFGTEMPTRVRIAGDSQVHFELRDRRVFHEGLAFGLPELAPSVLFRTSGTVGLDRSLDLRVDVPLALDLAFSGPLAKRLSGKTLRLAVTGTLDAPHVSLVPETTVVRQLSDLLRASPEEGGVATEVAADDVIGLAQEVLPLARDVGQNVAETIGDTLARIRERRAERRSARNPRQGVPQREPTREEEPGDLVGDALPPAPLDEGEEVPAPPARDEGDTDVDDDSLNDEDSVESWPTRRRGPLRRLFDRSRQG